MDVVTYGPDVGQYLLADMYYGYHYGNTAPEHERVPRRLFARRIRTGRLLCHAVFVGRDLVAVYGTAIRLDEEGPYVEIEFFLGDLGVNFLDVLRAMVMQTYKVARAVAIDRLIYNVDHVRVRVRGRKGWRRALAMVGARIDADGWCRHFNPLERWQS